MAFAKELDPSTWDAFAQLVERNKGIFGGCWCKASHSEGREKASIAKRRRKSGCAAAGPWGGAVEQT